MEDEIYVIIQDFPNYQISNFGNVKNINTNKILKSQLDKDGYLQVLLYCNKLSKTKKIHRLVGKYFIPNPENKPEIDHIDNNPLNNSLSNLRWATSSENNKNRGKKASCSSKYIGVSYHKKTDKWRSRIILIRKETYIGLFATELEAANARDNYIIDNNLNDGFLKLNKDLYPI